mmetsp:Transcript_22313/g.60260  ORF Transcript_22313/g.60260 Transcript_22313/m.60260 type:complete len:341 (+) Transcript_22313:358-1380(+)
MADLKAEVRALQALSQGTRPVLAQGLEEADGRVSARALGPHAQERVPHARRVDEREGGDEGEAGEVGERLPRLPDGESPRGPNKDNDADDARQEYCAHGELKGGVHRGDHAPCAGVGQAQALRGRLLHSLLVRTSRFQALLGQRWRAPAASWRWPLHRWRLWRLSRGLLHHGGHLFAEGPDIVNGGGHPPAKALYDVEHACDQERETKALENTKCGGHLTLRGHPLKVTARGRDGEHGRAEDDVEGEEDGEDGKFVAPEAEGRTLPEGRGKQLPSLGLIVAHPRLDHGQTANEQWYTVSDDAACGEVLTGDARRQEEPHERKGWREHQHTGDNACDMSRN